MSNEISKIRLMNGLSHRPRRAALLAAALFCLAGAARAQEAPAVSDNAQSAAQANNPLAKFTAFNVHDYYIGELTDPEKDGNQVWLRFAKPFTIGKSLWLMRASLPIITSPVPPEFNHQTGIGDFNVFAAYLFDTGNPAISFGIGPQITAPTASNSKLGSEKWSAGLVNTLFVASSKVFQYGYLLSWQASFAGADDRAKVNLGTLQPFLFYQLGKGTYLRSTGAMAYNFEASTYSVPIGLGIGQVIPRKKAIYNIFIEPQISVADKGPGWAKWQIFIGFNTQFK